KNADRSKTALTERTNEMDARYQTAADGDVHEWKSGDASGPNASTHRKMVYGIQSPFTGVMHYPPKGRCWANEKKTMKAWLEAWGSEYQEKWIDDGNEFIEKRESIQVKALVLKGMTFSGGQPVGGAKLLKQARIAA